MLHIPSTSTHAIMIQASKAFGDPQERLMISLAQREIFVGWSYTNSLVLNIWLWTWTWGIYIYIYIITIYLQ